MGIIEIYRVHEAILSHIFDSFRNEGINFLASNFIHSQTKVKVKEEELKQILHCLIQHATEAMPQVHSKMIKISANENSRTIQIDIVHNGPLMDEEETEKLFQAQDRLGKCRELAESLGGKLYLDEMNEKVKFILELPKA